MIDAFDVLCRQVDYCFVASLSSKRTHLKTCHILCKVRKWVPPPLLLFLNLIGRCLLDILCRRFDYCFVDSLRIDFVFCHIAAGWWGGGGIGGGSRYFIFTFLSFVKQSDSVSTHRSYSRAQGYHSVCFCIYVAVLLNYVNKTIFIERLLIEYKPSFDSTFNRDLTYMLI